MRKLTVAVSIGALAGCAAAPDVQHAFIHSTDGCHSVIVEESFRVGGFTLGDIARKADNLPLGESRRVAETWCGERCGKAAAFLTDSGREDVDIQSATFVDTNSYMMGKRRTAWACEER